MNLNSNTLSSGMSYVTSTSNSADNIDSLAAKRLREKSLILQLLKEYVGSRIQKYDFGLASFFDSSKKVVASYAATGIFYSICNLLRYDII